VEEQNKKIGEEGTNRGSAPRLEAWGNKTRSALLVEEGLRMGITGRWVL